jgi:hypothetical protein
MNISIIFDFVPKIDAQARDNLDNHEEGTQK